MTKWIRWPRYTLFTGKREWIIVKKKREKVKTKIKYTTKQVLNDEGVTQAPSTGGNGNKLWPAFDQDLIKTSVQLVLDHILTRVWPTLVYILSHISLAFSPLQFIFWSGFQSRLTCLCDEWWESGSRSCHQKIHVWKMRNEKPNHILRTNIL